MTDNLPAAPHKLSAAPHKLPAAPHKLPAAPHKQQRLRVLQHSGLVHGDENELFERVTRLARRLLGADTALVSLVGDEYQTCLGHDGLDGRFVAERGSPLSHLGCKYAVASGDRFVVGDARRSPLLRESPAIVERDVVAYAGVPLQVATGEVLGTLCVIHSTPREWRESDVETLDELAALVRIEIDHRLRIRRAEEVESVALRLLEPMSRLGDVVKTTANLAEEPGDPRLPRMADVLRSRLSTVQVIVEDLERTAAAHTGTGRARPVRLDLTQYLLSAVQLVRASAHPQDVEVTVPDEAVHVKWAASSLSRGLRRLLIAAMHHMDEEGVLKVVLARVDAGDPQIHVESPGRSMRVSDLLAVVGGFTAAEAEDAVDVSVRQGVSRVRNRWVTARTCSRGSTFDVVLPAAETGSGDDEQDSVVPFMEQRNGPR